MVRHIVKTQGAASLFKGSAATLARDGTGSYAYFAAYELIKRTLTPPGQTTLSPTAVILGERGGGEVWSHKNRGWVVVSGDCFTSV